MPKMKSHRGAKKRFSLTASGKVKFKRNNLRHCLEHKRKSRKAALQKPGFMADVDAKRIRATLLVND